jgi:hypothetical protein
LKKNLEQIRNSVVNSGRFTPLLLNKDKPEKVLFREFIMQYYRPLLKDETTFKDLDTSEKKVET